MKEDDHFKHEAGKRIGAYDSLVNGIRFLIEVDSDKYTEAEQDELAHWITKALAAKQGHDKYQDEIIHFVNSVAFTIGRPVKLSDEQVKKVQEIFHWAAAYVLGFEQSQKEQGIYEITPFGKTYHFH